MNRFRALAWYAKQWIGAKEQGPNKGQIVEMFQKAVDGKAEGEPWCMGFVQFCLKGVDSLAAELTLSEAVQHRVWKTEHCMTAWMQTPHELRVVKPEIGCVAIWQQVINGQPTSNGHTGIVVQVLDEQNFVTVEGNTGMGDQREGDGVGLKNRNTQGMGSLKLVGFLRPWDTDATQGGSI